MIVEYRSVVVGTICRLLAPFLQIYALYVIMHGHSSPGGGFQGGVIMGASFILLVISMGAAATRRRFSDPIATPFRRRRAEPMKPGCAPL